jgi:hypothetical protein
VRSLPEPVQEDTPFGAFSLSAENAGGKVILKSKIAINKSRIKPAEYAAWRAFCASADRAFSQRLIIGGAK